MAVEEFVAIPVVSCCAFGVGANIKLVTPKLSADAVHTWTHVKTP